MDCVPGPLRVWKDVTDPQRAHITPAALIPNEDGTTVAGHRRVQQTYRLFCCPISPRLTPQLTPLFGLLSPLTPTACRTLQASFDWRC